MDDSPAPNEPNDLDGEEFDGPPPPPMPLPPTPGDGSEREALTLLVLAWTDRAEALARFPDAAQGRRVVADIRREYTLTRLLSWHPHGWRLYVVEHTATGLGHLLLWVDEAESLGPWLDANSQEALDCLGDVFDAPFEFLFDPNQDVLVNHRPDLLDSDWMREAMHCLAELHDEGDDAAHTDWIAKRYREDATPAGEH